MHQRGRLAPFAVTSELDGCDSGLDGPYKLGDHMVVKDSSGQQVCCPWAKVCAGCAVVESKCQKCVGVYPMKHGVCTSCLDTPWKNAEGQRCEQMPTQSCNDATWQGLSSNRACCMCGGGHRSTHPWRYWVGPLAVGVKTLTFTPCHGQQMGTV